MSVIDKSWIVNLSDEHEIFGIQKDYYDSGNVFAEMNIYAYNLYYREGLGLPRYTIMQYDKPKNIYVLFPKFCDKVGFRIFESFEVTTFLIKARQELNRYIKDDKLKYKADEILKLFMAIVEEDLSNECMS